MPSCVIKGCFNTWKLKESQIILHVFPKDKEGIRLWLSQSPENFPNIEELVEKIYDQNKYGTVRLCSKHFSDDQYFHEGSKRRLKPNALPSIFPTEILPSEKAVAKKGTKKRKKDTSSDESNSNEMDEGTSSSVSFSPPASASSNAYFQPILPSQLQIVLPSTSLFIMDKPQMVDKAAYTEITTKCQAVGTYPMLGKRNFATQTKPWKGKSQGVLCTILTHDLPNSKMGVFQHQVWPTEKMASSYMGNSKNPAVYHNKNKPHPISQFEATERSTSAVPVLTYSNEENMKVERMSPPTGTIESNCGHSTNSNKDGQVSSELNENVTDLKTKNLLDVKKEDPNDDDSKSEGSTDDSDKDESETKANFVVLQSCLYDLIKLIRCQYRNTCHAPLTNVQVKSLGTVIAIDVLCCNGHNSTLWHSQPIKSRTTAGNSSKDPSQQVEPLETQTFFHNFENDDELPD